MTIDYNKSTPIEFDFDESELLDTLVKGVMEKLGCPFEVSVSVSVVGEDEIRRINNEFREMDSATDVLSFPMNEFDEAGVFEGETFEASMTADPESEELMLGDIVLCADKVKAQAAEYGHSEKREYAFLIVHSLLHLCGFDHITDADRLLMEKRQREILESIGIFR